MLCMRNYWIPRGPLVALWESALIAQDNPIGVRGEGGQVPYCDDSTCLLLLYNLSLILCLK